MAGLPTDVITNITNTGYTVRHQDGSTTDVVASFNNSDETAFLYREGGMEYEFNIHYITARGSDLVVHKQVQPTAGWTIKHNLNKSVIVSVMESVNDVDRNVLPRSVRLVNANTVDITHSVGRVGVATVR